MLSLSDLDYELPEELIAQVPPESRDAARLLVLNRASGEVSHRTVRELPALLPPALFVVNDTRVVPARLIGVRPTGGRAELLLLERLGPAGSQERWVAMARPKKRLTPGTTIRVGEGELQVHITAHGEGGEVEALLTTREGAVMDAVERVGRVPLPPYIRREAGPVDRARYQTVFAARPGAVAAPTAGLHLSERLLAELRARGHGLTHVTLHVGPGTFQPVQAADLEGHDMHAERYEVSAEAARAIAQAREDGRPVVAVGTTVVRTLESAVEDGTVHAGSGKTRLFIRPPYRFRAVDALLTNFHLPRSTLLALVMAFGGVEPVRRAYAEAVRERYRFYSYGDAMLVAPTVSR